MSFVMMLNYEILPTPKGSAKKHISVKQSNDLVKIDFITRGKRIFFIFGAMLAFAAFGGILYAIIFLHRSNIPFFFPIVFLISGIVILYLEYHSATQPVILDFAKRVLQQKNHKIPFDEIQGIDHLNYKLSKRVSSKKRIFYYETALRIRTSAKIGKFYLLNVGFQDDDIIAYLSSLVEKLLVEYGQVTDFVKHTGILPSSEKNTFFSQTRGTGFSKIY